MAAVVAHLITFCIVELFSEIMQDEFTPSFPNEETAWRSIVHAPIGITSARKF
jgi:hypothetical protein